MKKLLSMFLLILTIAAVVCAHRAQAQVIIVANPVMKVNEISKNDLRDLFTGLSTSLPDGTRVAPILLKAGTVSEDFLQAYIGKRDAPYRAAWRSLVFSGQSSMPRTFDSDAEVVAFIAHNLGAIGYIAKTSPHEGVRVINIR